MPRSPKLLNDKNKVKLLQIKVIQKDRTIRYLHEQLYKSNLFGLEITQTGNFKYRDKLMKVSTDSNSGKFLKHIIENNEHFISDEYCKNEFNCQTSKEITYIIRDLNKTYLSKDNLKAKLRRCRDAKGYILEGIVEIKS